MNTFTYFRIEKSTPTDIISTTTHVHHMEFDMYRQGHILYTGDQLALMTSDGTTTHLIAGTLLRADTEKEWELRLGSPTSLDSHSYQRSSSL